MSMYLFTSSSCSQCHSLLQDPLVKNLQRQGKLKIVELHSIDQNTREQLFASYSTDRMVPFLVYPARSGYTSLVGKTDIVGAFQKLGSRH